MPRLLAPAILLCAVAVCCAIGTRPAALQSTVTLAARPGQADAVARAARRAGAVVTARAGRYVQVRATAAQAAALGQIARVERPSVPQADAVISQGVARMGADVLRSHGLSGKGVRIAVVDLGFGLGWRSLLGKELPRADEIDAVQSFDRTTSRPEIEGLSASGAETSHGVNVAQVAYDIAPDARYTFVNYHTQVELSEAVDWLINGPDGRPRVDVVVHSNSFLDGPFDGTGIAARAVDRAHAAGILWVNSAGNYAQRHWEGTVGDADGDGFADVGTDGAGAITFALDAGQSMGATLWWSGCDRPAAYQLEIDRSDRAIAASGQRDGDRSESVVGVATVAADTFALRVRQLTPGARCTLEIFVAGAELGAQAVVASSVPTPGDARGALAVGARDWRGDAPADYSSQGPTEDGRPKPELVAPASTVVWPGLAMVGTSASAPHAAGAAALLIEQARALGQPSDPDTITAALQASALDLETPGFDSVTGAGRIRLDTTAPVIVATRPAAGEPVAPRARVSLTVDDDGTIEQSGLLVDGQPVVQAEGVIKQLADLSALTPGPHTATFWVRDMAGNRSEQTVPFTIDPTPPTVTIEPSRIVVRDASSRRGTLEIETADGHGRFASRRTVPVRFVGGEAVVELPRPIAVLGAIVVRARAWDEVGNRSDVVTGTVSSREQG